MTNDQRPTTMMRIAWFSPLPPVRSGIADANARLLPRLEHEFSIDRYDEPRAHDFVWHNRRAPYDLVVYQLGNASCHDFIWAYLARFPGLVVVHDPTLHHARARLLLGRRRFDDYRREFQFDHPDANRDVVEYAVEGLGGPIYYFWSMLPAVMKTARLVAVHNERVAADLREEFPQTPVEAIHLGIDAMQTSVASRAAVRAALGYRDEAIVFAAFGKLTSEKRIAPIVRACAALAGEDVNARLLLVGDASAYPSLSDELAGAGIADRAHVTGFVGDEAVAGYLAAADVCLCLRWPTARETSASWLQCLSASRPTVISDLAHTVDVPENVAIRIDLLNEDVALPSAMHRLATDARLRGDLAQAGYAYWAAHHTMEVMANDYRRIIRQAAAQPIPAPADLPSHLTDDYTESARAIVRQFGLSVDVLVARPR
jgi:glycosyltransferase involved in cell wall biosynthesis